MFQMQVSKKDKHRIAQNMFLHNFSNSLPYSACMAYQYALEMPLCLDHESQMGRPVCHSVCLTFAKDCQLESDSNGIAFCPKDGSSRQCEMGPLHSTKAVEINNDGSEAKNSKFIFLKN